MPSDEDLIGKVLSRDAHAFDALFARYRGPLRRHLERIVRDRAGAEDLLQEVFLRVWTRAEQWSGEGAVRAWLFRIGTNLALNHLRSARRRRHQPLEARPAGEEDEDFVPGWMVDASALGPEETTELAERAELFRRLIGELSEEKREVMRLIHEEQMDLRQAAEQLGVPVGTVKSRLFYARKTLQQGWKDIENRPEET